MKPNSANWNRSERCTALNCAKWSEWHSDASWQIKLILVYIPGPICESQLSLSWGVHNACVVQSCCHQFLVKLALIQSAIVALIYITTRMPSNSLLAQRIPNGFLRNWTLFQHWDLFQFVKLTERSFLNTRHKKNFPRLTCEDYDSIIYPLSFVTSYSLVHLMPYYYYYYYYYYTKFFISCL